MFRNKVFISPLTKAYNLRNVVEILFIAKSRVSSKGLL